MSDNVEVISDYHNMCCGIFHTTAMSKRLTIKTLNHRISPGLTSLRLEFPMIFNPGDLARDKETGEIVEVVEEEFREHPFELLYVVRGVTGKVCYFVKPTNMESISALEALGDQVDSRD